MLVRTQHLPRKTPGQTRCRCSRRPGLQRVRGRFGRPLPVSVGQWWARSGQVSGLGDRVPGTAVRGRDPWSRSPWPGISAGRRRVTGSGWRFQVQLGPLAGAEGPVDVLAGDLVAAGHAVGVGGEQDTHAVPGAGSDLGGRGAGGQPQRQRGMAKVIGAACRLGACRVAGLAAARAWCQIRPQRLSLSGPPRAPGTAARLRRIRRPAGASAGGGRAAGGPGPSLRHLPAGV